MDVKFKRDPLLPLPPSRLRRLPRPAMLARPASSSRRCRTSSAVDTTFSARPRHNFTNEMKGLTVALDVAVARTIDRLSSTEVAWILHRIWESLRHKQSAPPGGPASVDAHKFGATGGAAHAER
jgi:hypothetical protein